MKHLIRLAILSIAVATPVALTSQERGGDYNHGQVGIFADYFRFAPNSSSTTNFVGFGARAGFNVSHHVMMEG